jgi:hypothetical protein
MKKRWEYSLCHAIADDEIAIGCAEISAEASGSLAERVVRVCPSAVRSDSGLLAWRQRLIVLRLSELR